MIDPIKFEVIQKVLHASNYPSHIILPVIAR